MKFLQANKYYYLKSGSERHLFELAEVLERHGHTTIPFAMHDARNVPTPWSKYFVSPVKTESAALSIDAIKAAGRTIYSFEAKRKMEALIRASRPDIAHIFNIYHQLSSSVLDPIRAHDIPAVLTVLDYRLLSPNYSLYHDGEICERPIRHPFAAVTHKCLKGSYSASLIAALETSFVRWRKVYERTVKTFIVPSKLVYGLFERAGWDMRQFKVLGLFLEPRKYRPQYAPGDGVVFVGRLSQEKNVETLIAVAKQLPDVRFRIVGTGPMEVRYKSLVRQWEVKNVEFLGFLDGEPLHEVVRSAAIVACPSAWHETFGLTVIEGMALGKPVIASNMGAYPELLEDEMHGFLVPPKDVGTWVDRIRVLLASPSMMEDMGRAGRLRVEREFSAETHYRAFLEICQDALLK